MNIVVSNEGERFLQNRALNRSDADPLDLACHIYGNDYVPNKDTALADFEEVAWPGYVPAELAADDWTAPETLDGQAVSWFGSAPLEIPADSDVTQAFGFYVTNNAGDLLVWSARFDSPQLVSDTQPCVIDLSYATRSASEPEPP